ncbi:MAG: O-antigen ligase family protein [Armatimonadetes bacterium]|nr:O-antigen ligase family protein [Armatimonadota bacterium]
MGAYRSGYGWVAGGIGFLLFTVPLYFTLLTTDPFELPKKTLFLMIAGLLLLAWAAAGVSGGISRTPEKPLIIAVALAFSFQVMSACFSLWPPGSFRALAPELGFLLFFWLVAATARRESLGLHLLALSASGVLAGSYGICQHFNLDIVDWNFRGDPIARSCSTLGNPIFLAGFLVMVIPLACALSLYRYSLGGRKAMLLGLAAVSVMLLCLVYTYSLGGWIAFVPSMAFFLFAIPVVARSSDTLKLRTGALYFGLALIAVLGLLLAGERVTRGGPFTVARRLSVVSSRDDNNVLKRIYLWESAVRLAMERPLSGWGPGMFSYAFLKVRKDEPGRERAAFAGKAHNEFLDVAASSGIPGLLSFAGVFAVFFRLCFQRLRRSNPRERILYLGIAASGIAYTLHLQTIFPTATTQMIWFFLLGIIAFPWPDKPPESDRGSGVGDQGTEIGNQKSRSLWGLLVLAALLTAVADFHLGRAFLGDVHMKHARDLRSRGAWKEAAIEGTSAVELSPSDSRVWQERGKTFEGMAEALPDPDAWVPLARRDYEEASRLNPLDPYPLADLGRLLALSALRAGHSEHWTQCFRSYEEALGRDPYNLILLNDLAVALVRAGKWAEAEKQWQTVLSYDSRYSTAHRNLGFSYLKRGKEADGIRHLEMAVSGNPGDLDLYAGLGEYYMKKRNSKLARKWIQAGLVVSPASDRLRELLRLLNREEAGKTEDCREVLPRVG